MSGLLRTRRHQPNRTVRARVHPSGGPSSRPERDADARSRRRSSTGSSRVPRGGRSPPTSPPSPCDSAGSRTRWTTRSTASRRTIPSCRPSSPPKSSVGFRPGCGASSSARRCWTTSPLLRAMPLHRRAKGTSRSAAHTTRPPADSAPRIQRCVRVPPAPPRPCSGGSSTRTIPEPSAGSSAEPPRGTKRRGEADRAAATSCEPTTGTP